MNKTLIIFVAALALVVGALVFGVRNVPPDQTPPVAKDTVTTPKKPDKGSPDKDPADKDAKTAHYEKCSGNAEATASRKLHADAGDFRAALSQAKILDVSDDLFAVFDIETIDMEVKQRPPLNLALVIDRSGSMRGPPINRARSASEGLVSKLGEQDRVAVITYDTTGEVVVPSIHTCEEGKERIISAIRAIDARGMTNIQEGLQLGYRELQKGLDDGVISRMIHLSDGQANVGITDTPSLVRMSEEALSRGIRTTSVGFGVHYNEKLMEGLAEAGRGQYYYVRDSGDIDRVFAGELSNIQATFARNVELILEPCGKNSIEEIYGLASRKEDSKVIVSLADLSGKERRRIVARIKPSPEGNKSMPILNAHLGYEEIEGRKEIRSSLSLGVGITDDTQLADASINKDVMGQVLQAQSAVALREAVDSFSRGDHEGAMRRLQTQEMIQSQRAADLGLQDLSSVVRSREALARPQKMMRKAASGGPGAVSREAARDVMLEAGVEARSMERERSD